MNTDAILAGWEDSLLESHLETQECHCLRSCLEKWGECCGDCPACGRDDDDGRDYEREAEDRAERRRDARW